MKTKIDLHGTQVKILEVLLFKPKAKFTELNKDKLPTDQFSFHVREMVKNNLIEKDQDGLYGLTLVGREFVGRYDTKTMSYEKQPKSCVVIIAKDGEKILTQQRLKSPYYGYYGYISGKIKHGEKLMEAAERELMEETGLSGKLRLAGIEHKMDYGEEDKILEDKFFYLIEATDLSGKLKEDFKEGKNVWMTKKEIGSLKETFDDMFIILDIVGRDEISFEERQFVVKGF